MQADNSTPAIEQTAPGWRTVARAAAATGVAALAFLALWSPTSAEVVEPGPQAAMPAGASQAADQLARSYGEWLHSAHGRAAANGEEKPLPAQF